MDAREQGRLAVERDRQMREQQREEQRAARERGELANDYLGQNRGMLLNDEDDVPEWELWWLRPLVALSYDTLAI